MTTSINQSWGDHWRVLTTLPEPLLGSLMQGQSKEIRARIVRTEPENVLQALVEYMPFSTCVWLDCTSPEKTITELIQPIRRHSDIKIASSPIFCVLPHTDDQGIDEQYSEDLGDAIFVALADETDSAELVELTSTLMRYRQGLKGCASTLINLEVKLNYQSAMLDCARLFLESGDVSEALREILIRIRRASNAVQVYVFENYSDLENGLCARLCFRDSDLQSEASATPFSLTDIQYSKVPSWLTDRLYSGQHITGSPLVDSHFTGTTILDEPRTGSRLFVPLFVGKVYWGLIGFDRSDSTSEWTPIELESIQALVSIYVAMLERLLLERLASVQRNLAIDLSATTELDIAFQLSLKAAMHAVGFDAGGIYIVDHKSRELVLKSMEGLGDRFIQQVNRYSFDSFEGRIVLSGESRYAPIEESPEQKSSVLRSEGLISVVNIPVRYRGDIIACLNLGSKTYAYVPDFLRKGLEAIAYQIGVALARITVEEQLRQSDENLRSILKHSRDLIVVCDADGVYRYVSSAAQSILGCAPEELIDQPIQFVHPDDVKETKDKFKDALDRPEGVSFDYRIILKSGEVRWVSQSWAPIAYESKDRMLVGIIRDITQAREARDQLHQSLKMEAIGRLAGGVAHEFNNMLTGILGYASLLRAKPNLDDSVIHAVSVIEKAAEQASQLTRQLLGFARKGKYQTIPVDIHASIEEVLALLRWTISKDIRVVERLNARSTIILGDPTQIQQVLLNLMLNACESMPDGGTLSISTIPVKVDSSHPRTSEGLRSGSYLLVTVSDTGMGIQPHHLPHIFEPFFTTKDTTSGTGMGLAMVYGIVKNHSGCIYVDSQVGKGSTFSLFFPYHFEGERETIKDDSGEIVIQSGAIMLIDDDHLIRETAESLLQTLGFSTHIFSNCMAAVEFYRNHYESIDFVIIDLVMPQISGLDCYRIFKQINPSIRALVSTGYSLEGRAAELRTEGIAGFIQKPYTLKQLSRIIDACRHSKTNENPIENSENESK